MTKEREIWGMVSPRNGDPKLPSSIRSGSFVVSGVEIGQIRISQGTICLGIFGGKKSKFSDVVGVHL